MPPGGLIPLEWIRSIDDIFAIWPHGTDRLMEFLTYINPSHPTIKFEYEYSHKSVHFLDTRIHINESNLVESDLYIKPTDRTLLLHHDSFHPNSWSQALQYRRLITNNDTLHKHLDNLHIGSNGSILRKHWHLINTDPTLNILWPETPLISYQRNKNLKDQLVHSKFSTN